MRTRLVFVFYFFRSDLKTHVSIVFCISNVKQSKLKTVKYAECVYPNSQWFFTGKYKILQLYPNGHPFFTAKCKILKPVLKQPFVFLQRNTKF